MGATPRRHPLIAMPLFSEATSHQRRAVSGSGTSGHSAGNAGVTSTVTSQASGCSRNGRPTGVPIGCRFMDSASLRDASALASLHRPRGGAPSGRKDSGVNFCQLRGLIREVIQRPANPLCLRTTLRFA